jgi:hypothetical protein
VIAAFALCACDDASDGPTTAAAGAGGGDAGEPIDGSPDGAGGGVRTPLSIRSPFFMYYENVFVRVTLDGARPVLLLYDSGAPEIYLDQEEANELGIGPGQVEVAMEGIPVGTRSVTLTQTVFGGLALPGLPDEPVLGYAGNALFEGYSVGLDFRDRELWVSAAGPAEVLPPSPSGVDAIATEVPFDWVDGYLSVPCAFAAQRADRLCLFDTGAMTSLSFESYWSTVPHPQPETIPQESIDSKGDPVHSYFQRSEASTIGSFAIPGDAVAVSDDFELLVALSQALDLDLVGLIGVLTFKSSYTTIDYANRRLLFQPYADLTWMPPSPFWAYGFVVSPSFVVQSVLPKSSAEAAGILIDDKVIEIDGVSVAQSPPSLTLPQMIPGKPGEAVEFALLRGGQTIVVPITAEDTLPAP